MNYFEKHLCLGEKVERKAYSCKASEKGEESGSFYLTNYRIAYSYTKKKKSSSSGYGNYISPLIDHNQHHLLLNNGNTSNSSSLSSPVGGNKISFTSTTPGSSNGTDGSNGNGTGGRSHHRYKQEADYYVDIPISSILKFEKITTKKEKIVEITCKDIRQYKFIFTLGNKDVDAIEERFHKLYPVTSEKTFAFFNLDKYPIQTKGWYIYDAEREYNRMGISNQIKTSQWAISMINIDYGFSETYPKVLVIPSSCNEKEFLSKVAAFRTTRRIPVLSWRHRIKGSVILRSSQPKVGLQRTRSKEDELLVSMFRMAANPHRSLVVMDARPKVNAVVNQARGAGYEDIQRYEHTVLEFLGIENIHTMKESYKKLRDAILSGDSAHFYSNLESSRWLDHIALVIESSVRICELIEEEVSVLIHCSDGWDRTSQLSSISMLLLDPFYRTFEGFMILIEKEWLSFGHMFFVRTHGAKVEERSPIFVQFIDCVWQITSQFPHAFEFNERFLLKILDALYSCQFGTFLYDCEKERSKAFNTPSFWSFAEVNKPMFVNPFYSPPVLAANSGSYSSKSTYRSNTLFPTFDIKFIRLWEAYYCRGNSITIPLEKIEAQTSWNHNNLKLVNGLKDDIVKIDKERESSIQRCQSYLEDTVKLHANIEELKNEVKIKDEICDKRQQELLKLYKEKDYLLNLLEKNNILIQEKELKDLEYEQEEEEEQEQELVGDDGDNNDDTLQDNEYKVNSIHDKQHNNDNSNSNSSSTIATTNNNNNNSVMDYSISLLQKKICKLEFELSKIVREQDKVKSKEIDLLENIKCLQSKLNEKELDLNTLTSQIKEKDQIIVDNDKILREKQKYVIEQEKMYFVLKQQIDDLDSQLQEYKIKLISSSIINLEDGLNNSILFNSNNSSNSNVDLSVDSSSSSSSSSSNNNTTTTNRSNSSKNNSIVYKVNNSNSSSKVRGFTFGTRDLVDVNISKNNMSSSNINRMARPHTTLYKSIRNVEIIDDYLPKYHTIESRSPPPPLSPPLDDPSSPLVASVVGNGIGSGSGESVGASTAPPSSPSPNPPLIGGSGKKSSSYGKSIINSSNENLSCTGCCKAIELNAPYIKGKKDRIHCEHCEKDYQTLKQKNRRCSSCEKVLEKNPQVISGNRYCNPCINKIIQGIDDLGF
ncbi:hypothetical protein CYY_009073 [Polysphondylium violaceum]|uniref:Myotubularin phosphatase domain-containing protein n=1 Tax=Polysphondylium violaceum TaxID=133409 RepID=A0A8J4PMA3_9MYCE|nr:hypothetical protein CYY_009073 [Polysphondylium violaceum]